MFILNHCFSDRIYLFSLFANLLYTYPTPKPAQYIEDIKFDTATNHVKQNT